MAAKNIKTVVPFERDWDKKSAEKVVSFVRGALHQYGSDSDYRASLINYLTSIIDLKL